MRRWRTLSGPDDFLGYDIGCRFPVKGCFLILWRFFFAGCRASSTFGSSIAILGRRHVSLRANLLSEADFQERRKVKFSFNQYLSQDGRYENGSGRPCHSMRRMVRNGDVGSRPVWTVICRKSRGADRRQNGSHSGWE